MTGKPYVEVTLEELRRTMEDRGRPPLGRGDTAERVVTGETAPATLTDDLTPEQRAKLDVFEAAHDGNPEAAPPERTVGQP